MITVACYAVYRGADLRLLHFLRGEAQRNATLAIGVDIMFLSSFMAAEKSTFRALLGFVRELWRDLSWYVEMLYNGHLILPLPALISSFELFMKSMGEVPTSFRTVASLYASRWPNAAAADEIMATYLRFVASPEENYGLEPFDGRFLRLLKRWEIYSMLTNILFSLIKPKLYLAIYSGYLHHKTPCDSAVKMGVPTLVLGCGDCLYRVSDSKVPRQFDFVDFTQSKLPTDFAKLSEIGSRIFAQRVKGSFDSTMSYMKVSAYEKTTSDAFWAIPTVSDNFLEVSFAALSQCRKAGYITVYMHELDDWHHNGVLPTFATSYYDWLRIIISFLIEEDLPYVLKVHPCISNSPSSYSNSVNALVRLATDLNTCLNVTTSLSTIELINAGMKLGVTVRGTVALELAYLRTPFVCTGRPPYAALFPSRIEVDLCLCKQRLKNFANESAITDDEVNAASYFVALHERSSSHPVIDVEGGILRLSPNQSYKKVKKYI
ncbi:MAG: hypothetical protein WCK64_03255 [Synechococcaceae cyanobacterium ELA445]